MADDDVSEDQDVDEEDLEDLSDDLEEDIDDLEDLEDDDDTALVVDDDTDEDEDAPADETPKARKVTDEDDDDDEDEPDPDDVEDDLDTILKDRIASGDDLEDDEDEEELAAGESASRAPARRIEEFVCQSCFLLKPHSQLADAKTMLCADCV